MKTFRIKIKNSEGLHARPASGFVSLCHKFISDIKIVYGGIVADGKNITEVLGLGIEKGDYLNVKIRGKDEQEAERALKNFFLSVNSGAEKI
jgi:phosphotransferase system HPr (HPr) family protein